MGVRRSGRAGRNACNWEDIVQKDQIAVGMRARRVMRIRIKYQSRSESENGNHKLDGQGCQP